MTSIFGNTNRDVNDTKAVSYHISCKVYSCILNPYTGHRKLIQKISLLHKT